MYSSGTCIRDHSNLPLCFSSGEEDGQLYAKHSLSSLFSLEGKTAIVTGAAQGFGFAIAERLSEAGAAVAVVDVNGEGAEKAVELLRAENPGARIEWYQSDVTVSEAVDTMVNAVEADLGAVDILVNNAGTFSNYLFHRMPREEFERIQRVNVLSTFLCSQRVVQSMLESGREGQIINVASQDAFRSSAEGLVHLTTSKHAIAGLTRSLAMELGPHGIRVNAVCPGASLTEGVREFIAQGADEGIDVEEQWDGIVARTPLGRLIEPDEIGVAVAVIASGLLQSMHGHLLPVEGGILVSPIEGYVLAHPGHGPSPD